MFDIVWTIAAGDHGATLHDARNTATNAGSTDGPVNTDQADGRVSTDSPSDRDVGVGGPVDEDGTSATAGGAPRPAPGARRALACQAAAAAPELLTPAGLLDVCEDAERQIRWAQAVRIRMLAEFAARHPADTDTTRPGAAQAMPSRRWVADEVGLALGISRHEASGQLAMAERFTTVLPDTLAALETAQICWRRAEALVSMTAVLPPDKARQVEARVLPKAADATPKLMRDRIRRAIAHVDPDGEYRRHTEAVKDRRVAPRSLDDGMASLWCYGSAEQIEAAWTMVDRLARSLGTADPRTLDQRRFDLTVQILQGRITVTDPASVDEALTNALAAAWAAAQNGAAHDEMATTTTENRTGENGTGENVAASSGAGSSATVPGGAGSDASAQDTADAATAEAPPDDNPAPPGGPTRLPDGHPLTGREHAPAPPPGSAPWVPPDVLTRALEHVLTGRPDLHATVRKPLLQVVVGLDTLLGSNRPAELVGHGPIDADTARKIAADATIHRLTTDPLSGNLLDYGRDTYTPPAALDDHVRARDQICRGPRCTRRIRDLDHHIQYGAGQGGQTSEANLNGYCLHCHLLKDVPGWQTIPHPTDGSITWISPCGRKTVSHPFDYRDFTDDLSWDGLGPPSHRTTGDPAAGSTRPVITETDDEPPPF